ncbi:hypothetical protein [Planococcus sp. YIM B11945]|uniref:hypothetical protein n=1 Tax=Planococcus sp. YIM B11945 TaxID=3435410 RepID=UPI003D7E0A17
MSEFVRLLEREAMAASFLVRQTAYHLRAAAVKQVAVDGTGPLADAELRFKWIGSV